MRSAGLSRVGQETVLTVLLDRTVKFQVTTRTAAGKPQLVVEFYQARAGRLPDRQMGDEILVEQVLTEVVPAGGGVRIVLELIPDVPYTYWKRTERSAGGQVQVKVGLKPEGSPRRRAPSRSEATAPPEVLQERVPEPLPPSPQDYGYREERGSSVPGSFAELRRLVPKAGPLLQSLEASGWVISEFHHYDRPGQRYSRDFTLTQRQYPELVVNIVHIPANAPNTPNISIASLSTERVGGEAAAKYRDMRQWSFAKIKQNYEDIGDFFDDALKPLRIKLREETKALTLRLTGVFQNFLKQACPRNPQVADKVMTHVREKVNQRFEGVQYTESEDPLVLLSLVDFLYVRVYLLETH